MSGPIRDVHELLELLGRVDRQSIAWEAKKLAAIRDWAMRQIGVGYVVGDRVVIAEPVPTGNGWSSYREALAVGATAVVTGIDFNPYSDGWHADIILDREWSIGGLFGPDSPVSRYWHGPADETPDGFVPPSDYEHEHSPAGRKHTFSMRAEWLRLAPAPVGASA